MTELHQGDAEPGHPTAQAGDVPGVSVTEHDGLTVAAISGEIDIASVEHVGRVLTGLPSPARGLVIDLAAVEFMDSSAISLLHELAERLRQRGQRLAVICPPGAPPRRMLELTGLGDRVALVDALGPAARMFSEVEGPLDP